MYSDKVKEKEWYKQYRIKNKERISQRGKKYRLKHRDKLLAYQKEHYRTHKEMYRKSQNEWRKCNIKQYIKAMKSWEGFIPKETICQVCGKAIYFNNRNHNTSIHFDHRRGNEAITGSPARWLRDRKRTPESEAIWKSCDFGMLCQGCNRSLPTNNRQEFLLKALEYSKL